MIFCGLSGLGRKKFSELYKIISAGPDGKCQGPPQKKSTNGLGIKTEKRIMDQQRYDVGDLETGFVFSQIRGRNVFALFGNNIAETGYSDFSTNNEIGRASCRERV